LDVAMTAPVLSRSWACRSKLGSNGAEGATVRANAPPGQSNENVSTSAAVSMRPEPDSEPSTSASADAVPVVPPTMSAVGLMPLAPMIARSSSWFVAPVYSPLLHVS
jgi:hypothetical protein